MLCRPGELQGKVFYQAQALHRIQAKRVPGSVKWFAERASCLRGIIDSGQGDLETTALTLLHPSLHDRTKGNGAQLLITACLRLEDSLGCS